MDDSNKLQVDLILQKYSKIKMICLELKSANKKLEEVVDALRIRWKKTDEQRFNLIKMFKNTVIRNKEVLRSLQKENTHLQNTVQEQNVLIEEYSNKIDELNTEKNLLKEMFEYKEGTYNECLSKSKRKNGIQTDIKQLKEYKGNFGNFSHPSFATKTKALTKSKKKVQPLSQYRWSNLDILVKKKNVPNKDINSTSKTEEILIGCQKKRKLYIETDSVVDLESEKD